MGHIEGEMATACELALQERDKKRDEIIRPVELFS